MADYQGDSYGSDFQQGGDQGGYGGDQGGYGGGGQGGYGGVDPSVQQDQGFQADPYAAQGTGGGYGTSDVQTDNYSTDDTQAQDATLAKKAGREEDEFGAAGLAAGGYAAYEAHEIKADPAHAERHRLEEDAAGLGAVVAGGGALYERHEKRDDESAAGEKKSWF